MKYFIGLITLMLFIPGIVTCGLPKDQKDVIDALHMASHEVGVPYKLIASICYVESNYNPRAIHKFDGNGHSYGLCQIKIKTAKFVGFKGKAQDLYDPYINAFYASKYLKYQLSRYKDNWIQALAAYNRGSVGSKIHNTDYVTKVLKVMVDL